MIKVKKCGKRRVCFLLTQGSHVETTTDPSEWSADEDDLSYPSNRGKILSVGDHAKGHPASNSVPLMRSEMKVYLNYVDNDEYSSEDDVLPPNDNEVKDQAAGDVIPQNDDRQVRNDPQSESEEDAQFEYNLKINSENESRVQPSQNAPPSQPIRFSPVHKMESRPSLDRNPSNRLKDAPTKPLQKNPSQQHYQSKGNEFQPGPNKSSPYVNKVHGKQNNLSKGKPHNDPKSPTDKQYGTYRKESSSQPNPTRKDSNAEIAREINRNRYMNSRPAQKLSRGSIEEPEEEPERNGVQKPNRVSTRVPTRNEARQPKTSDDGKLFGRKVGKFVPDLDEIDFILENDDQLMQSLNAQTDLSHIFDFDENEVGTKFDKEVPTSKTDFDLVKNLFDTRLIYADNEETDSIKDKRRKSDFGRISKGLVDKLRDYFDTREQKARKELELYRIIHNDLQSRHNSMREWDPVLWSPFDESFVERYQYRYHVRESRHRHNRSISMSRTPIDSDFIERGKYRYIVRAPRDENSFSLASSLLNTPASSMMDVRGRNRTADPPKSIKRSNIPRTMSSARGLDYYGYKHNKQFSDPVFSYNPRINKPVRDVYKDYDMLPPPVDELKGLRSKDEPDRLMAEDMPDIPMRETFLSLPDKDNKIYNSNYELSMPRTRERQKPDYREPKRENSKTNKDSKSNTGAPGMDRDQRLPKSREQELESEKIPANLFATEPDDIVRIPPHAIPKVRPGSVSSSVGSKNDVPRKPRSNRSSLDPSLAEDTREPKRSPRSESSVNGTDSLRNKYRGFVDRGIEKFENKDSPNYKKQDQQKPTRSETFSLSPNRKPNKATKSETPEQQIIEEPILPEVKLKPKADKKLPKKNDLQKFVEEAPCDKTSRLTAFYSPRGYGQLKPTEARETDENRPEKPMVPMPPPLIEIDSSSRQIPGTRMVRHDPFHEDHSTLLKHENESFYAHNPITGRTIQIDGIDSLSEVSQNEPTVLIKTVQRTTEERLVHIESMDELNKIEIDDSIREHANRLAEMRHQNTFGREPTRDSSRSNSRFRRFVPKENKHSAKYKSYDSLANHGYDSSSLVMTQERSRSLDELNSANQKRENYVPDNQIQKREKAEHSQTEEDMESPLYQHQSSMENIIDHSSPREPRRASGSNRSISTNQIASPGLYSDSIALHSSFVIVVSVVHSPVLVV